MSDQEAKVTTLRLPPELYQRIAAIAAAEYRSVNGQILVMLIEETRRREAAAAERDQKNATPRLENAYAI